MIAPPGITLRQMREGDLPFAASCTAAEGWVSENLDTIEAFYSHDASGCFLAEKEGQPVGICVATSYGTCGFIGELIVVPSARGCGVGASLLNQGVTYLMDHGAEAVYLDGVLKAVELYQRNGFRKVCRSWRFSGQLPGKQHPQVRRMQAGDLEAVSVLDYSCFGADRRFFLQRRLELFSGLCFVYADQQGIAGFIQARRGEGWLSSGPWVVLDRAEDPLALLSRLSLETGGISISMGILDANRTACDMARASGFIARSDSPWRMVLGAGASLGLSSRCFAVGSAAKG